MKRFVDLGQQICSADDGSRYFAFYCTFRDAFETFSGNQCWESIERFKEDYNGTDEIERYLNLIPINWGTSESDVTITIMGRVIRPARSVNYTKVINIANLKSDLIEVLQNEDYETAAILRDKIKKQKPH